MGTGDPIKISRSEDVSVQPPGHDSAGDRELLLGDIQGLTPTVLVGSDRSGSLEANWRCREHHSINCTYEPPKHEQPFLYFEFATMN
jgi:hypothetical protein